MSFSALHQDAIFALKSITVSLFFDCQIYEYVTVKTLQ